MDQISQDSLFYASSSLFLRSHWAFGLGLKKLAFHPFCVCNKFTVIVSFSKPWRASTNRLLVWVVSLSDIFSKSQNFGNPNILISTAMKLGAKFRNITGVSSLADGGVGVPFGKSVNPIYLNQEGQICPPHYKWHPRIFRASYGPASIIENVLDDPWRNNWKYYRLMHKVYDFKMMHKKSTKF